MIGVVERDTKVDVADTLKRELEICEAATAKHPPIASTGTRIKAQLYVGLINQILGYSCIIVLLPVTAYRGLP